MVWLSGCLLFCYEFRELILMQLLAFTILLFFLLSGMLEMVLLLDAAFFMETVTIKFNIISVHWSDEGEMEMLSQ